MTEGIAVEPRTLALALIARGLSVIPLGGNKRPTRKWKHWQTKPPSVADVRSWTEAESIAILTGSVNGIVVADCESVEDTAWTISRLGDTCCKVRTRRGYHLYYRQPEQTVRNAVRVANRYDVRGEGGYVVAPNCVANGHEYRWHTGGFARLGDCPVFDVSVLPVVENVAPRVDDIPAQASVVDRARRWLSCVEPAISGQGGRKQTWKACCGLVRDFALSESQAWNLLVEWNQLCDPPWEHTALMRELRGAGVRGVNEIGRAI